MALETIDLHAGIEMAAGAKMLWVGIADAVSALCAGLWQSIQPTRLYFAIALTIQHRVIALMQQQIHVLAAHDFDRLNAGAGVVWFVRLRDDDCTKTRTFDLAGSSRRKRQPAEQGADQQERQGFRAIDHWLQ